MSFHPKKMRTVQQRFKIRGLGLTKDALQAVLSYLNSTDQSEAEALDAIFAGLEKHHLKSSIVSAEVAEEVLLALSGSGDSSTDRLVFIDAFKVPKNRYDPIRKGFHPQEDTSSPFGEAASKAALYRDRLAVLQQRLLRNRAFTKSALQLQGGQGDHCQLTPLQSLVGSQGIQYVMGAISQLEDGRFFLEDFTTSIPIDLSGAQTTSGLFTENSTVVAEGELLPAGTFKVHAMGFPPLESKEESLSATGRIDFFGGGAIDIDEYKRLQGLERAAEDETFVILSDIWLDSDETMAKMDVVLDGYEQMEIVPSLFVFCGDFCSKPCNLAFHDFGALKARFAQLGEMIAAHPRIHAGSRFVFIPGPGDIGPANVLPRPALPQFFTDELQKHLPNAVFSSSPCRIRFYAQEIVIFRENLQRRMRRACLVPPVEDETCDVFAHLAGTVLQLSHLCPLPLTSQPIYWEYDHALRLYPVPDILVLADRTEQKEFIFEFKTVGESNFDAERRPDNEKVTCFNPGSFSQDGTFVLYRPATRKVELSAL